MASSVLWVYDLGLIGLRVGGLGPFKGVRFRV